MTELRLVLPPDLLNALTETVRRAVEGALAEPHGFIDVAGAASFLSSTPDAVRALVKRNAVPFHRAPNGRLLFDRQELGAWVRSSTTRP